MIADVVFNTPLRRTFHYLIPDEIFSDVSIGCRVEASFGRRKLIGVVVGLLDRSDYKALKPVLAVCDESPLWSSELIKLAQWIADYYVTSLGQVLFSMIPPDLKPSRDFYGDEVWQLTLSSEQLGEWAEAHKRQKNKIKILFCLKDAPLSYEQLHAQLELTGLKKIIQELAEEGLVQKIEKERGFVSSSFELSLEQENAYQQILKTLAPAVFAAHLLFGVTGSGKTEVYLRLIESCLREGKGALVLVPEIALTPQLFERFEQRFPNQVAVLHSQLTPSVRQRMWWDILQGRRMIVVGSRSAVFAPVANLGIIIVDEEHEGTYKQDDSPRYHARDVAVMRAKLSAVPVVLGSATPSFESFYNAKQGKYSLIEMPYRVGKAQPPKIGLIDMRYDAKKNYLFSRLLFEKILQRLQKKEQVILFLNRRGTSPVVMCESCGYVVECAHCDVSLTYHESKGLFCCHYCEFQQQVFRNCPKCQLPLQFRGIGTQKLQKEVCRMFPQARVERLDTDSSSQKGHMESVLQQLTQGDVDILIGTQMVAKGLDVANVTLIGVIDADGGLYIPDFRSAERMFQLLHQVAGRAGRGAKLGEVVIQTRHPDHEAIQAALKNTYELFYEQEMQLRSGLKYPPYVRLVEILFRGTSEKSVSRVAREVVQVMKQNVSDLRGVTVLGPAPMPILVLNKQYRWHVLLKSSSVLKLNKLVQDYVIPYQNKLGVKVLINVDPVHMI